MRGHSDVIRFWARVDKSEECWNWTGATNAEGYASFFVGARLVSIQRYSYAMAYGPIPDGRVVRNTCGNRLCVVPDHLYLSTASERRSSDSRKR